MEKEAGKTVESCLGKKSSHKTSILLNILTFEKQREFIVTLNTGLASYRLIDAHTVLYWCHSVCKEFQTESFVIESMWRHLVSFQLSFLIFVASAKLMEMEAHL